jgi:pantoate--beta-alanine ligase
LHAGHVALVRKARELADEVVVSIYVNPTQFGPQEDYARYPRQLEQDVALLGDLVDIVFSPHDLYPEGFDARVQAPMASQLYCGALRPGHFDGVCTVVLMLMRIARCQVAVFGEKDYQQLAILRHTARDLWLDVDIVGVATVREADGLAMSSRNTFLSAGERVRARQIPAACQMVLDACAAGESHPPRLEAIARSVLTDVGVEYVAFCDPDLGPREMVRSGDRMLLAARVGVTRLIDNVALALPPGSGSRAQR